MKKVFGIILAAALSLPMFAETKANADYSDWLPKAGDWNVQVGMNPLAIVMGGTWSEIGGFSASYMVTDMIGVRATLGLDVNVWNNREYARDDAAFALNGLSKAKVVDTQKIQRVGGSFSLGADFHVGSKSKVQGVFGVGLMYGFKGLDQYTYTYGNAITEFNQKPSVGAIELPDTHDNVWSKFAVVDGEGVGIATGITDARVLRQYNNGEGTPRQMAGLYLNAGVEWFVTPKLALGMNASLNFMYQFMTAYTTEYEGWSQIEHKVVRWTESEQPYEDGFNFSTSDGLVGLKMYLSVYL